MSQKTKETKKRAAKTDAKGVKERIRFEMKDKKNIKSKTRKFGKSPKRLIEQELAQSNNPTRSEKDSPQEPPELVLKDKTRHANKKLRKSHRSDLADNSSSSLSSVRFGVSAQTLHDAVLEVPTIANVTNILKLRRRTGALKSSSVPSDMKKAHLDLYEFLNDEVASDDDVRESQSAPLPLTTAIYESEIESETSIDDDYRLELLSRSIEESPIQLQQKYSAMADFFDIIGDMPLIDDLSERSDISEEVHIDITPSIYSDVGKFVNPLTGADITTSSESVETTHAEEPQEAVKEEASLELEASVDLMVDIIVEDDEDLEKFDDFPEIEESKPKDFDIGKWLNISIRDRPTSIGPEYDAITAEKYLLKIKANVDEFLDQLINNVVTFLQYTDAKKILRDKLDKKKLMNRLIEDQSQLNAEQRTNVYLNRTIIDVLRRKRDYRYLSPDSPESEMLLQNKYVNLTDKLFNLKYREEEFKFFMFAKISKLEELVKANEDNANKCEENFAKLVNEAFHRRHFHHFNELVLSSLKQMSAVRDEISSRRLLYFEKLDTFEAIKEKLNKLEDIGNNLTLRSFENLQGHTTKLSLKVDERHQELIHLHHRYNQFVNKITHMKDSNKTLLCKLQIQQTALEDLIQDQKDARNELNYQKSRRRAIRSEIQRQQHQSGLAGNDLLLMDFDKTKVRVDERRAAVDLLKQKIRQLETRFISLERRYTIHEDDDEES